MHSLWPSWLQHCRGQASITTALPLCAPMAENQPSERVYVSSLPVGLDGARFKEVFGAYGTISDVKMLQNNAAIVIFDSAEEAKWVVENLNGNMPEGISTPVVVKYANPQRNWSNGSKGGTWTSVNRSTPYGSGGGSGGGDSWEKDESASRGGKDISIQMVRKSLLHAGVLPGGRSSKERSDSQQVHIRGLPPDTTDADLRDIFGPFGAIPCRGVKAMLSPEGHCTGIGFVDFVEEECAEKAAHSLNGISSPDGTALRIQVKKETKGKGGAKGTSCKGVKSKGVP
mmetsp:Transcript_75961/g.176204  ORF Transcript_75961/g.176204 Transcript_75961/m.176204 type:complete len:285 (-) Transcript_75961:126-980(-)|eukprot:CAMPEP_0171132236 /NCGR_PEP_ID=MMETSP0766_2-20121228/124173_1 /TAXON_ID=439317 /ORGANISM="Gambierdiscus australes, Strain CAWD 149" /LENGTH=284 /DNA_ID=CAMNT_0011595563 /DNA_START=1 /DNA_END=855 /DNA_ORIENTATION=-